VKAFATLRNYLPRLLRVGAAASVIVIFFTLVFVKQVNAQMNDLAVHFGDELARLPGEQALSGAIDGDFYRVSINGAHANVSSGVTKSDVATVLADMFADCTDHADGMVDDFKDLRHAVQPGAKRARTGAPGFSAVKELVDNDKGYVVCFANGHEVSQLEAFPLVREAATTGDLTRLGHVRYVTAKKQKDGSTLVVAVWTNSPFNVKTMFPKEGDTPGSDPVGIARPAGSRRLLTSTVEGAPAAVRVYEVPMNEDEAMAFYSEALPKAGYQVVVNTDAPQTGRMFAQGPVAFLVTAKQTEPGKSAISITESRMDHARVLVAE